MPPLKLPYISLPSITELIIVLVTLEIDPVAVIIAEIGVDYGYCVAHGRPAAAVS